MCLENADRFFKLTKMADFLYISCNFNKDGELQFAPMSSRSSTA